MTTWTRRRVARKRHPACGGYCPTIQPGEVYLEAVEFPGAINGGDVPWRMHICARHALDHDPSAMDGVPFEMLARQGLL